jgi:hypothetical protein
MNIRIIIRLLVYILKQSAASTKEDYLEINFNNRNQVDDKIASGLGAKFLYLNSSFVR